MIIKKEKKKKGILVFSISDNELVLILSSIKLVSRLISLFTFSKLSFKCVNCFNADKEQPVFRDNSLLGVIF